MAHRWSRWVGRDEVDNDVRFRRFVKDHFPGWDELVMMYELGWRDLWGGGDHIRKASTQLRNRVGGRQLFSIGHSEGGDILFRSIVEASTYSEAAVTLGTPIKEVSPRARDKIGFWLDICYQDNKICAWQPFGKHNYLYNRKGPSLTISLPGGSHGFSTYVDNLQVKDAIQSAFRERVTK